MDTIVGPTLTTTPADPAPDPIRALLVEDDETFAYLVRATLLEVPGLVEVAVAGHLAGALAQLVRGRFDLVLSDLNLPDSQGSATVAFLHRAAPDIPLVVLSADDDIQLGLRCIQEGAEEYVVKGRFSIDALIWLVRLLLERHRRVMGSRSVREVDLRHGDLQDNAAFQVVGRYLLRVATRLGLTTVVAVLQLQVAPRGRHADLTALVQDAADVLAHTLRRCDLISRTDQNELAVLLVQAGEHTHGGVTRLRHALAEAGLGTCARLGLGVHNPDGPDNLDDLLERARRDTQPLLTS